MRAIADIDKRLAAAFPDYAALVSPAPISVEDVQALLFLDTPELKPTPEETFIWVVTKTDSRWVRSELGTPSLKRGVAALRCGLDYDGTWGTSNSRCSELRKTSYTEIDYMQDRCPSTATVLTRCTKRCLVRLRTSSRTSSCSLFRLAH
jgi:hypothetical protein